MGISLPPLPNVSPQVIATGGAPDPVQGFLQALLGGANLGSGIRQDREHLALQRQQEERIAREQERLARENETRIANARAEGNALRALILGGQQQPMGVEQQGFDVMGGMGPAPSASAPASGAPAGPMGALARVLPDVPAENVTSFVQNSRNVLTDQQTYADKQRRFADIENAVGTIKDESKRPGARALLTFAEAGANLPSQVQAQLWPELFPPEGGIDPAAMNAATTLFRTGVFTWGQARRQAGLQSVKGIPDDVKFEPFPTRPRQDQLKAGAQLDVMVAAKPVLDEYSTRKAPGPLASFVKGGKPGGWRELLSNPLLSPQDKQFLQGARQFTDAWVRVVSGAQTNEQEYGRFIAAITEAFGDDTQTRQQKRNMRGVMVQAVSDIAGGAVTPTQAIDRALKLEWTPEQKKFLFEERRKAERYESDLKKGKASIDTSSPAPGTPEDLQDQLDEIRRALQSREP